MGIVGKIRCLLSGPPEDPARRAEREKLEYERGTIKTSQVGLGMRSGPSPSTLPPTPDVIDSDRE